ncbi:MAG: NDP-sugar synthase, partial [Deltaproteobacteria bacterium]|nr:NDP-sugar synthase [Deltaproteobacteria bacterium]
KDDSHASGLVNAGVYVMEPLVLKDIPAGRALSLERTVLPLLLARGERLQSVEVHGHFFDIGTPESYAAFARFTLRPRVQGGMDRGESLNGGTP